MKEKNEIIQSNKEKTIETALKSLISIIPIFGGPVSSLLGDYFSGRKEKRFIDFIEGIESDLEDNISSINEEFILKEDFHDIFELTARKIVLTRQEQKRKSYRKILSNSMTSKDISYDEMEEFISILDTLRTEHIFVLKILEDPEKYDEKKGNLVGKGGNFSTSISQIMDKLLPDWEESEIIEVVAKLESERIIKNISNRYNTIMSDQGINHLNNCLTDKGIKFCKFILE